MEDVDEFVKRANELGARFEEHEADLDKLKDATVLRELRHLSIAQAEAEQRVAEAVAAARRERHSWASIGAMLGTSGEAARQEYRRKSQGVSKAVRTIPIRRWR